MAFKIIIELNDVEEKALLCVARDCQEWAENAVKHRCRRAIEEIVQKEVQRRLNAGEPIPQSKEEIVMSDSVKTAIQLEQESEGQV